MKLLIWLFQLLVNRPKAWWAGCPFLLLGGPETTIQQAPTTPAPSAGESARDIYQARLQYDPQVAEMEQGLAEQYQPQQAALQASLYGQYAPQIAGLQQDIRQQYSPTQSGLTEAFAQTALQRIQDPYGEIPEEQQAIEDIRQRQREQLQEQIRTRSNLGGGLYGGRAQNREEQALTELEQAFATQDIGRRQQGAQTALQYASPVMQQLYPQVSYPGQPRTQQAPMQSAVPGANTLYNAMFQASQPDYFASQSPNYFGSAMGLAGTLGSAALLRP